VSGFCFCWKNSNENRIFNNVFDFHSGFCRKNKTQTQICMHSCWVCLTQAWVKLTHKQIIAFSSGFKKVALKELFSTSHFSCTPSALFWGRLVCRHRPVTGNALCGWVCLTQAWVKQAQPEKSIASPTPVSGRQAAPKQGRRCA